MILNWAAQIMAICARLCAHPERLIVLGCALPAPVASGIWHHGFSRSPAAAAVYEFLAGHLG
jgi:hypothetical protein